MVEEIQKEFPDRVIEVVTNPVNVGNAENFKRTQEIAENEYTAVFHDDDVIHPEYIERAMHILTKNPGIVYTGGGAIALYNCSNDNWPPMNGNYVLYPSVDNAFFQLLAGRLNFCTAIYKTSAYKRTAYHPEIYGKLHDIPFLVDIGLLGDCVYIPEICVRWRQHPGSDSNTLSTGPFPGEVINILSRLNELTSKGTLKRRILTKVLLYNFSYFLYGWSKLERFCTWEEFKEQLYAANVFKPWQISLMVKNINFCNKMITRKARKYWPLISRQESYRICDQ